MPPGAWLTRLHSPRGRSGGAPRHRTLILWAGVVAAVLLGAALFSRFSLDDRLSRDEAIYAYEGQQLMDGIPPYVSIFDPKTPLAGMLAAGALAVGRPLGASDVHAIRIVFFIVACLAVGAVYLLAAWLFESPAAGILSAATFASFEGFAHDALTGPDVKTPGVLFAVLSMALAARRRYFWAAFLGSLAFLVWQPLGIYAPLVVAYAALHPGVGDRLRRFGAALAGAAIPVVATLVYFLAAGALDNLWEATIDYPFTGVERAPETTLDRLRRIVAVVNHDYGQTRVLFWVGLAFVLALIWVRVRRRGALPGRTLRADPYLVVFVPSFVALAAYSSSDFQGYPDLYPLLPYAAVGFGAGAWVVCEWLVPRRLAPAGAALILAGAAALAIFSWTTYSGRVSHEGLVPQEASADAVNRVLQQGQSVYAIGNPTGLVLTQRRNPSRFIYLNAGVDAWAIKHHYGSFDAWTRAVRSADPALVLMTTQLVDTPGPGSSAPPRPRVYLIRMNEWLGKNYRRVDVDGQLAYATPEVAARNAQQDDVSG